MPPGQRGRGRGGGASFTRGGGSFSRGRGGSRGSGRGRGRGRGTPRGRGRGSGSSIRTFENRPRDNHPKFPTEEEPSSDEENADTHNSSGSDKDDASSIISTDSEPEEAATAKPYSVLLQSLVSSKKAVEDENNSRKSKRRKLGHDEPEDVGEEADWVAEDDEAEEEIPEAEEDEDDEDDASDPFESHFASPTPDYLSTIKAAENNTWESKKLTHPALPGKILFSSPTGSHTQPGRKIDTLSDIHLKQKLTTSFTSFNGDLTPLQKALAPYIFAHQDLQFNSRTTTNATELRNLTCLHALSHIYKTRDKILKNNARLSRGGPDSDLELRDQGFTRPKVLFILPTRNACAEIVETIIALAQPEQQENKKRFLDSFTAPEEQERIGEHKPDDFRALFKGNHDDMFRLGLKFTRKTVKLFSQFYNSDIVFASPLGLRMVIGNEGDKKRDYDFLSSVEIVVVDQAEALMMQNWDHVEHVFRHLNLIPKDAHGCDFGRVRSWYLDSRARYLRQTVVLSGFVTPEVNALFTGFVRNIAGRVKTQVEYKGAMTDLGLQVRQTFNRFDSPTPTDDPNTRFKFFVATTLPAILRPGSTGTLIFIPSYYDFVRIRNHFETLPVSFGVVSEETSVSAVARARSHFLTGRHKVLLYTGRAHHFRRYVIRGATSVVFYQLPDNPLFYSEVAGGFLLRSVQGGEVDVGACAVKVLFSRWDLMRVERVVGSARVRTMCMDVGDTFEFV